MSNTCIWCHYPLRGRTDKKFCDAACKSAWHNRQKTMLKSAMAEIHKTLRANRRILLAMIPWNAGNCLVSKDELLQRGFRFQYHTETHIDETGRDVCFCYEFGLVPVDSSMYQVLRGRPVLHLG